MESGDMADVLLQDYPDRSLWTTWTISYQAIRNRHEAMANLLLLWSFLDHKDLRYGLLAAGCEDAVRVDRRYCEQRAGIQPGHAAVADYLLLEKVEEATSYATHLVAHQWAYHY